MLRQLFRLWEQFLLKAHKQHPLTIAISFFCDVQEFDVQELSTVHKIKNGSKLKILSRLPWQKIN